MKSADFLASFVLSPKKDETKRKYKLADPATVRNQPPVVKIPIWTDPRDKSNFVRRLQDIQTEPKLDPKAASRSPEEDSQSSEDKVVPVTTKQTKTVVPPPLPGKRVVKTPAGMTGDTKRHGNAAAAALAKGKAALKKENKAKSKLKKKAKKKPAKKKTKVRASNIKSKPTLATSKPQASHGNIFFSFNNFSRSETFLQAFPNSELFS